MGGEGSTAFLTPFIQKSAQIMKAACRGAAQPAKAGAGRCGLRASKRISVLSHVAPSGTAPRAQPCSRGRPLHKARCEPAVLAALLQDRLLGVEGTARGKEPPGWAPHSCPGEGPSAVACCSDSTVVGKHRLAADRSGPRQVPGPWSIVGPGFGTGWLRL